MRNTLFYLADVYIVNYSHIFSISDCSSTNDIPVDGEYGPWSEWTQCSATCHNGTRTRERVCQGQSDGGKQCNGEPTETDVCANNPCPVDGFYSAWSVWSACSVTCASGTRSRTRDCTEPQHGGLPCQGLPSETEACDTNVVCPVNGTWSSWTDWSACTLTCGNGTQYRNRTCTGVEGAGLDCQGDSEEIKHCGDRCPDPGYMSEWQAWAPCSVTCGGGARSRTRSCVLPEPHSDPCVGNTDEPGNCNQHSCAVSYATCTDLKNVGMTGNANVEIDPIKFGFPINVHCDMHDLDGVGISEIFHNKIGGILLDTSTIQAKFIDFEYPVDQADITSLMDVSQRCRQYVGWKCKNAPLSKSGGQVSVSDTWGSAIDFFAGGNPSVPGSCACSLNVSCSDTAEKCNCNNAIDDEQLDEGYYYSDDVGLPLSLVQVPGFGQVGQAILTVGPLECYGVANLTWGPL